MKEIKNLLERLEKAEPNSYQDLTNLIETHIENTENLNMLLDAIPKFIALQTGEDEEDAREMIPDIMDCNTPEEVCNVLNKWIKQNK